MEEYYGFFQYYEFCSLQVCIDEARCCIFLRWATSDKNYGIIASRRSTPLYVVMDGERFGLIKNQVVEATVHIVGRNMAINPHTSELSWTGYSFYINKLYRDRNEGNLEYFPVTSSICGLDSIRVFPHLPLQVLLKFHETLLHCKTFSCVCLTTTS